LKKGHLCELILEEIRGKGVRDFYLQVVLVVQSQYHSTFLGLTSCCQIIILFYIFDFDQISFLLSEKNNLN